MATEPDVATGGLFDDPAGFYPPEEERPPTTQYYRTKDGSRITLHLVGHSVLEAHHLWNGARVLARYFEERPEVVRGRTVLELGAGAGLPSLVAAALGARRVVVTDYPDADIVETMRRNIRECDAIAAAVAVAAGGGGGIQGDGGAKSVDDVIVAEGHIWGRDTGPLRARLGDGGGGVGGAEEEAGEGEVQKGFDVLVLADLLFRHTEHGNMLRSVETAMARRRGSEAFVFFTSYRPWLRHKDLAFFDLARERGFEVDKVVEERMERPMFEDDPGDEEVRKTCLGFRLRFKEGEEGGEEVRL